MSLKEFVPIDILNKLHNVICQLHCDYGDVVNDSVIKTDKTRLQ